MRTALIVDIDGTIAPSNPKGGCRIYRGHLGDIIVPEINSDFLRNLKCDAFWLSYQSGFIPRALQTITNIRTGIVLNEKEDKYDVLLKWAKDNDYDKIVWVDDDYDETLEDELATELKKIGMDFYHCVPYSDCGLTWEDRKIIEEELGIDNRPLRFTQHYR